jgi:predicted RNA binding protein YcfA (HicA-like mRNA interferase family)
LKRTDLVRRLKQMGCEMVRHGSGHDWWRNPETGAAQPVPRHREVNEQLARKILRTLASPDGEEAGA